MPVLLTQLPSAFLALFVIGGLWGGAQVMLQGFSSKSQACKELDKLAWFYVLLFVMAACLATRAWFKTSLIEWSFLGLLLAGNLLSLKSISEALASFKWASSRPMKVIFGVVTLVLLVDFLYASLPLYRYDQWTYHLVIAKWISKMGSLSPPVTYDPIFFTGSYEFLGLLARAASSSDMFQQGFQNTLSWLLVLMPAVVIFLSQAEKSLSSLLAALSFSLFAIFGPLDHEAVINAKPDYVLMMIGLLLILSSQSSKLSLSPFLMGFLLVAGVSFKLTWIHFAFCGPVILWAAFGRDLKKKFLPIMAGGVAALICLLPWIFKNIEYFNNPFHPVQTSLFKSSIWSPELAAFWQAVTMKPESLAGFLTNMLFSLKSLLIDRWILGNLAVLLLASFLWLARRQRFFKENVAAQNKVMRPGFFLACFIVYLVTWGLFYGSGVYNRFVSPGFSFVLCLVILLSQILVRIPAFSLAAVLAPLLPLMGNGQLEVSSREIFKASHQTLDDMSRDASGPLSKVSDLMAIGEDRKVRYPNASYTEATLLSDFSYSYYAPSAFWPAAEPVIWWHLRQAGVDPVTGDGVQFLRAKNISYVWFVDSEKFKELPPAIKNVTDRLKPLPSKLGKLYLVE